MMEKMRGKEFVFPENVESGYNLIKGVTVKSFFTVLLPFILLGVFIAVLPPYSIVPFLIKLFLSLLIMTVGLAITVSRPIKSRPNITVIHHMNFLKAYKSRQKLFYVAPKRKVDKHVE